MFGMHSITRLVLLVFIMLLLSKCTPASLQKDAEVKDMEYSAKLKPKDFPREIARLGKIAKTNPDVSVQARAHLQLAMLFLDYRNPAVNYSMALRELEAYISLDPEGGRADEVQTWRALLNKIEVLTKDNSRIKEENQKMNSIIEKMKSLDIQLEQKRKKY